MRAELRMLGVAVGAAMVTTLGLLVAILLGQAILQADLGWIAIVTAVCLVFFTAVYYIIESR